MRHPVGTHYTIINISFSFQKQKTGRKVSLSEQYLLDCAYNSIEASNNETGGCNGAWPEEYLYYARWFSVTKFDYKGA